MIKCFEIATAWRDSLKLCVALNDFCRERFDAEPKLIIGADPRELPGRKDAPFIAILPAGVTGGYTADETEVRLSVFAGVLDDGMVKDERELEYRGYRTIEVDFNPLILDCLEGSGQYVPNEVAWEVGMLDTSFFLLENTITVTVPNTLGM